MNQDSPSRLDGKVALVTGASKGIGEAVAAAYAAAGAAVMISSRKQDALDAAAAEIRAATPGATIATFAANAGEPDQAEACVAATVGQLGRIDILVNNAATNPHFGPLIDIELGQWDKVFQVNLRGVLVWTQQVWRAWMQEHGGVIVNMASVGGFRHGGGLGAYNTSKAGLIHLTKILAAELAPGVRVNALAPGIIQTDFSKVLWEGLDEARAVPLGRFGTPDDVAQAALFLASDASSWITGDTLLIDGGALVGALRLTFALACPTFTSFDGVTLAYQDDGDGAPVVLLHGFAADTNLNYVRSGVFDLLLDEGYRVIALDSRGHGLSEKPHDPAAYGDDAMRRDVQALLDELGIERCVIVGYSMGAAVTLRVAMTDPRPRAVALLGAGENMADKQGATERRTSMAEAFRADDVEALPARVRAFREMADAIRADRVALGALLDAPWPDTATDLANVSVPVIVICGVDDDEVGSPELLAAQLPNAEVVLVPGDHFTANSKPELHQALVAFLGRFGP